MTPEQICERLLPGARIETVGSTREIAGITDGRIYYTNGWVDETDLAVKCLSEGIWSFVDEHTGPADDRGRG